jgi:hypothetical protein
MFCQDSFLISSSHTEVHTLTHYTTTYTNTRWWLMADGNLLGGYSANDLRSYVFPLYTPGGVLVLQEAPPDHPHHQGIHVGLSVDGYDIWNAGSGRRERHAQRLPGPLGEVQPAIAETGIHIAHPVQWTTVDGKLLLSEERTVHVERQDGFTHVYWRSTFQAGDRPVAIDQTKEAGIALRVPPHWESLFGGQIRNAAGAVGEAACFDQSSPWLNIQGSAGNGQTAGVVFTHAAESEACPWFTRDYGEHVYNPSRHHPIQLEAGASFAWATHILAYDGDATVDEINAMVKQVKGTV